MTSKFRKGHGSRFRDLWLRNPSICVTHLTHDPFTHDLFWCRVKQTHLKILQLMLGHIVRSLSLPVLAVLHDIWWTVQLDADWLIVNNQVFHMYRSCLVIITSFHKRPTTQGILFSFRSIIKCEQTKQKKQSYIWTVHQISWRTARTGKDKLRTICPNINWRIFKWVCLTLHQNRSWVNGSWVRWVTHIDGFRSHRSRNRDPWPFRNFDVIYSSFNARNINTPLRTNCTQKHCKQSLFF